MSTAGRSPSAQSQFSDSESQPPAFFFDGKGIASVSLVCGFRNIIMYYNILSNIIQHFSCSETDFSTLFWFSSCFMGWTPDMEGNFWWTAPASRQGNNLPAAVLFPAKSVKHTEGAGRRSETHLFSKCACTAFPFHSFRKDHLIQNPRAGKLGLRKEKVLSLRKALAFRNRKGVYENEQQ